MNQDRYCDIKNSDDYLTFTFVSEGRHGNLLKLIAFEKISGNIYNLALGTVLPSGEVDFQSITNNGDRNKLLVTVADIIILFTEQYPKAGVFIKGSDDRRTVLYQRAIVYGYEQVNHIFDIYGNTSKNADEPEFELFDFSKNYSSFLVGRKAINA